MSPTTVRVQGHDSGPMIAEGARPGQPQWSMPRATTELVEAGDLDRIVRLMRLFDAAEDSVNDEIISRMAGMATDALCLIEQLTRNDAPGRTLTIFLRPEVQSVLVRFGEALLAASTEYEQMPPPKGGLGGLWKMLRSPGNQQAMQFLGVFGRHLLA